MNPPERGNGPGQGTPVEYEKTDGHRESPHGNLTKEKDLCRKTGETLESQTDQLTTGRASDGSERQTYLETICPTTGHYGNTMMTMKITIVTMMMLMVMMTTRVTFGCGIKIELASATKKSCEVDPLPTSLVKHHIDALSPLLARIINTSLSSIVFPAPMKHAVVLLVLKNGVSDASVLTNYRPKSKITFVAKMTERFGTCFGTCFLCYLI